MKKFCLLPILGFCLLVCLSTQAQYASGPADMDWSLLPGRPEAGQSFFGYGYMDSCGSWVIAPKTISKGRYYSSQEWYENQHGYKKAFLFSKVGWAVVQDSYDECYYYIGRDGKRKLNGEGFRDARACTGPTLFVVSDKREALCLDTLGRVVKRLGAVKLHQAWDGVVQVSDRRSQAVTFLDARGEPLSQEPLYDCSQFANGYAAAFRSPRFREHYTPEDHAAMIYDHRGQFQTGPLFRYSQIRGSSPGNTYDVSYHPKADGGVVDRNGRFVLGPGYHSVSPVSQEGWVAVGKGGESAVLDLKGNVILPWKRDRLIDLKAHGSNQLLAVSDSFDYWRLIDLSGRTVVARSSDSDPIRAGREFYRILYLGGSYLASTTSRPELTFPYEGRGFTFYIFDTAGWRFEPRYQGKLQGIVYGGCRLAGYPLARAGGGFYAEIDDGTVLVDPADGQVLGPGVLPIYALNMRADPGENPHYTYDYTIEEFNRDTWWIIIKYKLSQLFS